MKYYKQHIRTIDIITGIERQLIRILRDHGSPSMEYYEQGKWKSYWGYEPTNTEEISEAEAMLEIL